VVGFIVHQSDDEGTLVGYDVREGQLCVDRYSARRLSATLRTSALRLLENATSAVDAERERQVQKTR
jgi:hypothetical protein